MTAPGRDSDVDKLQSSNSEKQRNAILRARASSGASQEMGRHAPVTERDIYGKGGDVSEASSDVVFGASGRFDAYPQPSLFDSSLGVYGDGMSSIVRHALTVSRFDETIRRIASSAMVTAMSRAASHAAESVKRHSDNPKAVSMNLAFWTVGFFLIFFLLYAFRTPVFAEGAFGFSASVRAESSAGLARFVEARGVSVTLRDLSAAIFRGSEDDVLDDAWVWKRIVLTYQGITEGREVDSAPISLRAVQDIEDRLRSLPRWRQLCSDVVPEKDRRLCAVGDSLAAAAFGTLQAVSPEGTAKGVIVNVSMQETGFYQVISFEHVAEQLRRTQPGALKRWLPDYSGGEIGEITLLRSMFAFRLPLERPGLWTSMINEEVEDALVVSQNDYENLNVFYDIDDVEGLEERDISRSIAEYLALGCLGPLLSAFATLIVTQRVVLSLTAGIVAAVASSVTSLCLAGTSGDGDLIAVPAMALAAWSLAAVASADMAVATVRASEQLTKGVREPDIRDTDDGSSVARIYGRFAAEAWGPQFSMGLVLLIVCLVAHEVPLVAEFALFAGCSLLAAALCACLLLPSGFQLGVLLGERLRPRALRVSMIRSSWATRLLYNSLCFVECGSRHPWRRQLSRKVSTATKEIFGSVWVRLFVFVPSVVIVVVAGVSGFWPSFSVTPPRLFRADHHVTASRYVKSAFELPLPGPDSVVADVLGYIFACTVDSFESLGCAALRCDTSSRQSARAPSTCECYHQIDEQVPENPSCRGTAVRLFGDGARDLVVNRPFWSDFWLWLEARLSKAGLFLDNADPSRFACRDPLYCATPVVPGAPLTLEDWVTGGSFEQQQAFTSYAANATLGPPIFEQACNRVACFCSEAVCSMQKDADYPGEYSLKVFSGAWNLLCEDSQDCKLKLPTPNAMASDGGGGPWRRLEEASLIDVVLVVGLKPPSGPLRKLNPAMLDFDPEFRLDSLAAQRAALGFCEGLHPELQVVERSCWANDFRLWLQARGKLFPVPPGEDFYGLLEDFLASWDANGLQRDADLNEDRGRWWVSVDGHIKGYYITFKAKAPPAEGAQGYAELWEDYVSKRNDMLPSQGGQAWLVMPSAVKDLELRVIASTCEAVAITLMFSVGFFALCCTWNCGIAAAVALTVAIALLFLGTLACALHNDRVGAVEVVLVVTYTTCMAFPTLRVSFLYAVAQEGSGLDPSMSWVERLKLQQALRVGRKQSMSMSQKDQNIGLSDDAYQNTIWPGALAAERLARASVSVSRALDSFVAGLACAGLCSPLLLLTAMEGVGKVGMFNFFGYLAGLSLALGLLPVILSLGLGPSRARRRALHAFHKWRQRGFADVDHYSRVSAAGAVSQDGRAAAKALGWPYTAIAARGMRRACSGFEDVVPGWKLWSWAFFGGGSGGASLSRPSKGGKPFDDIPEEDGPEILGLDVTGATAMPPFHIVLETRDKFEGAG